MLVASKPLKLTVIAMFYDMICFEAIEINNNNSVL